MSDIQDAFCFNPWCDQPATVAMTVFNRPVGRTCEICAVAFTTTGERSAGAMAIVRELATECGPPIDMEFGCCAWCEEQSMSIERSFTDPATHDETCLWRRSVEWVQAQEHNE